VGAVRKALEILCQFTTSTPALSVSDLSRRLGMPKSTTHNLLKTLETLDFLKQDGATRRYRLGPRVYELGLRFSGSTHLVDTAMPYLKRLAEKTSETVKFGLLSCDEVLIVAAVESPFQLHTRGDVGLRAPLHCTGLGKAILAALDPAEVHQIVARQGLRRFTPHSIATVEELERDMELIRARGYALDREENELGVMCAAAAIEVRAAGTVAALSVSGPLSRIDHQRVDEFSGLLLETSAELERGLR